MTELLIVLAAVALLILALQPAHRRRPPLSPRSGAVLFSAGRADRDEQRAEQELRVAAERAYEPESAGRPARSGRRPCPSAALHADPGAC